MKKRIVAMLMAIVMLFIVSGCGNSNAESYKRMAQGFLDDGDTQSAIKVLEEGIEATQSDELKTMLDGLSSAKDDYTSYAGTWAVENIGWQFGGLTLDVAVAEDTMTLSCALTQSAPASRVAEMSQEIKVSDIVDSSVVIPFDNDGWGNSGTLRITFKEDTIECAFSDLVMDDLAQWGFYEETYELVRFENAHEMLVYTQEEYDELYGEPEETQPTYDTSKASGILAQLGMTEEQFRASCQPLVNATTNRDGCRTTQELLDYSSNYIGQHFKMVNSSGFTNLDGVEIDFKGESSDGYVTYGYAPSYDFEDCILIFDYRDDVYAPIISKGERIQCYMIFTGIQTLDGVDFVTFNLISADK